MQTQLENQGVGEGWESARLLGERWRQEESLARRCSLRIGGPARAWAEASSEGEVALILSEAADRRADVVVVGLGSNSLFGDGGLSGVAMRLVGELAGWQVLSERGDEAIVEVGAGVVNAHLVRGLHAEGWVGAEFLALVPGTFGGAVVMNAGTKNGDMRDILLSADVINRRGERSRRSLEKLGLGYRGSEVSAAEVVLGGRVRVRRGDVVDARARVKEDWDHRDKTQPYRYASVGSTFANPEGDWAGRLIDEAGLKGWRVGGARISELHANFFINEGEASAEDFLRLMALARVRVRRRFGVELRPEVRFVGFDGWSKVKAFEREWEEKGCD